METFNYFGDYYDTYILISISGFIYLAGIYYMNRRKERENYELADQLNIEGEKIRIANEMHDDLGADLSNLLFKLKIYQNSQGNLHLDEYHEIENFTKEIIKKVNETIWTLNSEKDTLISLSNFMLKFLDEYLGKTNISYQFQKEDTLPEMAILVEKRRNIFHLFKESIKYLVYFDSIANVIVELKFEHKSLLILISYEGKIGQIMKTEQQNLLDLIDKRIEILNAIFVNEIKENNRNEMRYNIEI